MKIHFHFSKLHQINVPSSWFQVWWSAHSFVQIARQVQELVHYRHTGTSRGWFLLTEISIMIQLKQMHKHKQVNVVSSISACLAYNQDAYLNGRWEHSQSLSSLTFSIVWYSKKVRIDCLWNWIYFGFWVKWPDMYSVQFLTSITGQSMPHNYS